MLSVEELAAATVFVDGRWYAGNGDEYASVDPSTAQPFATWHLADVAQADAGVAAARAAFAELEPDRTGGAGNGAPPVRRPAGEAPRGAGPARHHRGRLADLPRSHPADRDTGHQPEVGGRRRGVRTPRWLPRAAARVGGSAASRERAAPGTHRGGRRGDAVQLPGQHDRLEGRTGPGRRLHRRPAAVPARSAVLGRRRSAGRGGRRAARRAQPGAGRPGGRAAAQRAPGRRPGLVHRFERHRRRRRRGGRAAAYQGGPRARRQVADRGPAGRRPRARGGAVDAAVLPQRRSGLWRHDADPRAPQPVRRVRRRGGRVPSRPGAGR